MLLTTLRSTARSRGLSDRTALAARARTDGHRMAVGVAETAIRDTFAAHRRWYVAVSGGKDSAAVLALAAPIARDMGVELVAAWSDDELEYDEQHEYIPMLCETVGIPLLVWCGHAKHAGWFRSWSGAPYWRPPRTDAQNTPGPQNRGGRRGMRALGYRGVILGLRAQEAMRRRLNARTHGRLYETRAGTWHAQPLAWWRIEDVWTLLLDRAIPINPVYDRLAAIGVPLDEQRVGPLPLTPGHTLRAGWPMLYARLVTRYGGRW